MSRTTEGLPRARRLRIALFMDLSLGYSASVARGVARYVHLRHDWVFRWIWPRQQNVRDIREWEADAVIACLGEPRSVRTLAKLALPTVNVGRRQPALRFIHISNDDQAIGGVAAKHFIDRGLRSLAYANSGDDPGDHGREQGFRDAARAARCSFATYRGVSEMGVHFARRAPRKLTQWLTSLPKPVGVLGFNDSAALRVIEACNELDLAVPDVVAALGVDNTDTMCLMADPPLSSVIVAAEQIGYEAAEALERVLRGQRAPRSPRLVPPLGVITRQSSDVFAVADAVVVRALRFIAQHVHERPSVVQVARSAGVDRRTLERRFQAALERSPFDEVQRARIARAKELLGGTELSMSLIAEQAGFSGAKHFSAAFTDVVGMSPSAFRKRGSRPSPRT